MFPIILHCIKSVKCEITPNADTFHAVLKSLILINLLAFYFGYHFIVKFLWKIKFDIWYFGLLFLDSNKKQNSYFINLSLVYL